MLVWGFGRFSPAARAHLVSRMSATRKLLHFPFWAGVVIGVLGCVADLAPGMQGAWFLVVAALSSAGIFIPKRSYRVAATLLFVIALVVVQQGYYRQRLGL